MRILVVSDSHRQRYNLFFAIEAEPTAEVVFFLGDGEGEFEEACLAYSPDLLRQLLKMIADSHFSATPITPRLAILTGFTILIPVVFVTALTVLSILRIRELSV